MMREHWELYILVSMCFEKLPFKVFAHSFVNVWSKVKIIVFVYRMLRRDKYSRESIHTMWTCTQVCGCRYTTTYQDIPKYADQGGFKIKTKKREDVEMRRSEGRRQSKYWWLAIKIKWMSIKFTLRGHLCRSLQMNGLFSLVVNVHSSCHWGYSFFWYGQIEPVAGYQQHEALIVHFAFESIKYIRR